MSVMKPSAPASRPTSLKAILLAVFIAFGGFLFGYDIGVISGCLIMPDFVRRFGEPDGAGGFVLSSSRQSIITSLLSAGTFVGALAQAFTSDRFGRKGSILIWSGIFTIGVVVQTSTGFSIVQITIGRFIAGTGVGALSAIVPLYNGETAPKKIRGAILAFYQIQIISGVFFSYVIDLATHTLNNSASWRIPVGLQMLWGLILLSGIFFLPESPRHLLGSQRPDDARRVIAELNSVDVDDPLVLDMIEELEVAIRAENEGGKATWMECFSTRNKLWWRTTNGMMLQFIQQLNGQNFYYYYGDTFFKSAGTQLSPYVIQTILGAVSVVGTLPAPYLIETMGRRSSLLTGALMEAVCALIAGVAGATMIPPPGTDLTNITLTPRNRQGGDILIAFAVLHVFSFGLFWARHHGSIWASLSLYVSVRNVLLWGVLRVSHWIWNFLLSFFSPRIAARIGPWILMIFFGMLIFGFVYVYFFIPEVKGLSLEEVDELYRSGVKPWNSADWKPSEKHLHRHERVESASDEVRDEKNNV